MKKSLLLIIALILGFVASAQDRQKIDSLTKVLNTLPELQGTDADTTRMKIYIKIGNLYENSIPDSAIWWYQRCLTDTIISVATIRQFPAMSAILAQASNSIGLAYRREGNHSVAKSYYEFTLKIKVELGDKSGISMCLINIGVTEYYRGHYLEAISYYELAMKIAAELGNEILVSKCLVNLGTVALLQGNYNDATTYYQNSLKLGEKLGDNNIIAGCLINLGIIATEQGNYSIAANLLLNALNFIEETKTQNFISVCLINLGNLYSNQGNYSKAAYFYNNALKISEEVGDVYGVSQCLYNLGKIATDIGNLNEAISFYEQAMKVKIGIEDNYGLSNCYNDLGVIAYRQGRFNDAIDFFKSSLNIVNELKSDSGIALCLYNFGFISWRTKEYNEAISYFENALEISAKNNEKSIIAENCPYLANVYILTQLPEKALPLYLKSQAITKEMLADNFSILSEVEKGMYLEKTNKIFNYINEFTLLFGNQFDSLTGTCYDNELILKGLLLNSTGTMLNEVYMSTDTALKNTYFLLKQYRDEISAMQGVPPEEREKDIALLEKQANDEERKLVKMSSKFEDMQKLFCYRWQDVQTALHAGEAAIEFIEIKHTIYRSDTCTNDSISYAALLLKPGDRYPAMIPLCSYDELSALFLSGSVESSPELLAERGMIFKNQIIDFAACYQLIWQPLEKYLGGIKTVYFAPAGLLNKVSFAALIQPNKQLLLDKYELITLSSTKTLIENKKNEIFSMEHIALFGGIRFEADNLLAEELSKWHMVQTDSLSNQLRDVSPNSQIAWKFLPGTLTETENIFRLISKKKYTTSMYSGSQATEEVFKSLQFENAPEIIHVATHGFSIPLGDKQNAYKIYENSFVQNNNPLFRTGLLFAGAERTWDKNKPVEGIEDGILTAYEVSNMNLSNTQLVVLSACETGLGEVKGSEGVYGLQRAFKMAGVRYIIMSLWSVPDKETGIFMEKFYKNLVKLNDVRKAFTETQKYMRKKYEPYYWAAFVLVE